ncbi:hypothetical protein HanXRQr2_Chr06g0274131 [Helianthus annuus]|uniref:Uncharacterized protein n=1 Tax=Helianthus annuus TaxID=4232 RepID=A0A9K3IVN6_HELAN|nr:hypothetical protein HanXRQr2_Chr06g0274131 [Helianthus annuus]KAJ0561590.1 hypothetical protein HanHA300_Chr06g0224701 [Helianthus annuus]KAJ0568305.1 hypothetical protein HanIR_Chr06g0294691 [Helianthus annuus]KAJ0574655.1 hypothetical protein HanHA89_Chr06g0240661 [Helianthus annuus]KAJ0738985.1 hypothetical protein HanLR1_Chr06g0224561 [Helianthus annuus]
MNFEELKWFTNDFDQTYRFYKTHAYLRNVHDFLMGTGDTVEVIRHSRGDSTQSRGFTQSRLFDTVEVIRHSRGDSTQSRGFDTVEVIRHSRGDSTQSR